MHSFLKLLCLLFIVGLSYTANAQNNLEFSRVINQSITVASDGSTSYIKNTITLTVPAGKVWKIEAAGVSEHYQGSANYSFYTRGGTLVINDVIIGNQNGNFDGALPYWLAEGSHTLTIQGGTSSNGYDWYGQLSILEFTVVSQ